MRERKKRNNDFKYFVLIVVFILMLLLCFTVYSVKSNRKLNFIEKAIKDSVLYVGEILYIPFDFAKDKISDLKELIDIKDKYNELLKEQKEIDVYKQEIETLKEEVNKLKQLTDLKDIKSLYEIKNATVINRDYNVFYNTLTIDLGYVDGIETGMAVTANGVFIGRVESVSNFTSDIKLLSSDTFENKISVEMIVDDKHIYGLLTRYDLEQNVYIIEGVSDSKEILEDTKVITSGLSEKIPSGLLIGHVSSYSKDNFDLTRILKVTPAYNLDNINYVSVIIGDKK